METELCMKWIGIGVLAAASVQDIRRQEISGRFFAASATVALASLVPLMPEELPGIMFSLIPGLLLMAVAFLSREGIGYGDGLMILLLGPVYGWEHMAAGACLAFFLTAFLSVFLLITRHAGRSSRLPFIPFLTAAMGVVNLVFA